MMVNVAAGVVVFVVFVVGVFLVVEVTISCPVSVLGLKNTNIRLKKKFLNSSGLSMKPCLSRFKLSKKTSFPAANNKFIRDDELLSTFGSILPILH